jgi:hypothetical protein
MFGIEIRELPDFHVIDSGSSFVGANLFSSLRKVFGAKDVFQLYSTGTRLLCLRPISMPHFTLQLRHSGWVHGSVRRIGSVLFKITLAGFVVH